MKMFILLTAVIFVVISAASFFSGFEVDFLTRIVFSIVGAGVISLTTGRN